MKKLFCLWLCIQIAASLCAQAPAIQINELDFLVGNWKVEVESRLSMNGPWEKSTGSSLIRKILKNTILEEEFTGTRQGEPFLIKSIFGINNATNQFQKVFADSEHGVLVQYEGNRVNDTLFLQKNWLYANGNSVMLRVAYYKISADEFLLESMRMPPGATAWDVTGRMRYKRADRK